jgi:hypothetical protein
MLSFLPKLADRTFVVSFLLPTFLASFATAWAFPDIAALELLRSPTLSDKQLSGLVFLVVGVWLTAVFLMTTNYALFRLLEGYLPPISWLAPLRSLHKRRFRRLLSLHDAMMADWDDALQQGRQFPQIKQNEVARLRLKLLSAYPTTEAEILPTSFGNAIRAFEVYPRQVYGADAIPVWTRLASVVPKDYAAQINDARAQVDCFVNVACLAFILSMVALVRAAVHVVEPVVGSTAALAGAEMATRSEVMRWVLAAAAGSVTAIFSYRWAVVCARTWGEVVKGAFDCYLPALIRQLGYAVPSTEAERRAFWEQFNARVLYHMPMQREWPPTEKTTDADKTADDESSKPVETAASDAVNGDETLNSNAYGAQPYGRRRAS